MPIVVAIDEDGKRNLRVARKVFGDCFGAATAGKQHNLQSLFRHVQAPAIPAPRARSTPARISASCRELTPIDSSSVMILGVKRLPGRRAASGSTGRKLNSRVWRPAPAPARWSSASKRRKAVERKKNTPQSLSPL